MPVGDCALGSGVTGVGWEESCSAGGVMFGFSWALVLAA